MNLNFEDHRLPLVALKEMRRDLVMSLIDEPGPLPDFTLNKIAAIQSAITAFESVICDIDGDVEVAN